MAYPIKVSILDSQKHKPDLSILSELELKRYSAMSSDSALNFALGRSKLRSMLAQILDMHPSMIDLAQDKGGPIQLVHHTQVSFSVSHSGQYVAVAVSEGEFALGIDVEDISRPKPDFKRIIKRYFHEDEQSWILNQAEPLKAFYEVWTLKEAITKMDRGAIAHYLNGTEIKINSEGSSLIGKTPKGTEAPTLLTISDNTIMLSVAANAEFSLEIL